MLFSHIQYVSRSGPLFRTCLRPPGLKNHHHPLSSSLPGNHINPLYPPKFFKNPSSTPIETVKNPKCQNLTSTKLPTLLVIPITPIIPTVTTQPILLAFSWTIARLLQIVLSTRCGIIAPSPTRIRGFWNGYPHLSPKHGTTISEPVGLRGWETGSYKLRNIEIGWVVLAAMDLIVQCCFVTEVPGLGRPTLGKAEDIRSKGCMVPASPKGNLAVQIVLHVAVQNWLLKGAFNNMWQFGKFRVSGIRFEFTY